MADLPAPTGGAQELAQRFHEAYERLAPSFGYETREASAKPWSEVPDNNRALMTAVCAELLAAQAAGAPTPPDEGHYVWVPGVPDPSASWRELLNRAEQREVDAAREADDARAEVQRVRERLEFCRKNGLRARTELDIRATAINELTAERDQARAELADVRRAWDTALTRAKEAGRERDEAADILRGFLSYDDDNQTFSPSAEDVWETVTGRARAWLSRAARSGTATPAPPRQPDVAQWLAGRFGPIRNLSEIRDKAWEEVKELSEAVDALTGAESYADEPEGGWEQNLRDETADVVIACMGIAVAGGFDLDEALAAKWGRRKMIPSLADPVAAEETAPAEPRLPATMLEHDAIEQAADAEALVEWLPNVPPSSRYDIARDVIEAYLRAPASRPAGGACGHTTHQEWQGRTVRMGGVRGDDGIEHWERCPAEPTRERTESEFVIDQRIKVMARQVMLAERGRVSTLSLLRWLADAVESDWSAPTPGVREALLAARDELGAAREDQP